jgi:hypothetical protein
MFGTVVFPKEGQMRFAGQASGSILFAIFWVADNRSNLYFDLYELSAGDVHQVSIAHTTAETCTGRGMFDIGRIVSNSSSDRARVGGNPEKQKTNPNLANTFCVMIITCIHVYIASAETEYDCYAA